MIYGYSYKIYFDKNNLDNYKKQLINILEKDKDINQVIKKYSITYDELIEKIEKAERNLEKLENSEAIFKVNDFYCKFAEEIEDVKNKNRDTTNLLNIYIKQNEEFIEVAYLYLSPDYNIVQIKQLVKDHMCNEIGKILEDGTVKKEYCGQGWIYKNYENFYKREGKCYIAECEDGPISKVGVTFSDICEEIKNYLKKYDVDLDKLTPKDIADLAEDVFETVDWQLTSSLIFGDDYLEGYVEDLPEEYFINRDTEQIVN